MKIGLAGLGRMGTAMAHRLLETGHDLMVWNRSAEKAAPLEQSGARRAPSPAALAGACDVILTSLVDATALAAVYDGPEGLLSAPLPHAPLFIEMSTVRPQEEAILADKARAAGGAFLECPVGGTVGPARSGKLLGLAGGTAQDVARAMPILEKLCRRVVHVGPVGAGSSLKLAINLPLLVYYQALSEAGTLCSHLGLDPLWLVNFFSDTAGGMNVLKIRGEALAAALAGAPTPPAAFAVDTIRKDLRTMLEEAHARGTDLPVTARALEIYDAASRDGLGEADGTALAGYWLHHGRADL